MKTSKERQVALRARRAALGHKEIRGIWASNDEEKVLKPFVKIFLEELRSKKVNNEGLLKLINEYLKTLNKENKEEYYCSDFDHARDELNLFLGWVKERGKK